MATVNPDVFQKFKNARKLSLRQEGDGHEIEVEVREDEEQSIKLQEIIDLLVAAGYFRARIKGLSPFDKVVGGMTWCIESCNVDLDVDILFQENSTIGQKIALTEKVVAVLPKLKCPHHIEPHQIQGLDFIHIFPVIQWLVKRSMEHRQEMSAFVRSYAINQFHKEFPQENKNLQTQKQILHNVNTVRDVYRPRRLYKRKNAPPPDIQSRVQVTLLEYGFRGDVRDNTDIESNEDSLVEKEISERHIEHLLSNMTAMEKDDAEFDVLNEEERKLLDTHYASLQSEIEDGGAESQRKKQMLTLEQQMQVLVDRCIKLETDIKLAEDKIEDKSKSLKDIKNKQQEADKTLKELEHNEAKDPKSVEEIEKLVILNDSLRSQEIQFREHCKQELARLKNLIEETKTAKTPVEEISETSNEIEQETEKLKLVKLQLAKKNRSVAGLQRKLDDIPSRAEMAQYQRRFLELYNQVASKHKETKQYFTLYNTLEDTRLYMKKELSLLNSISENYPEAVLSNSSKEEFLSQLESIVDGVKQSKLKIEKKLAEEKYKRDKLSQSLQVLIEQQRRYVGAVRQLSIECKKQEAVLAKRKS